MPQVAATIYRSEGGIVAEQANEEPKRSPPYAFRVAALAIVAACLVFLFSMLIFGDLFNNATTVIAAFGALFTLIGTIVGAYFGIKVSNDTSERSRGAIERRTAARWRLPRRHRGRTTRRSKPSLSWTPTWPGGSCKGDERRQQCHPTPHLRAPPHYVRERSVAPVSEPPARGVILAGGIVRVLCMTVYEPPRLYIRNPAA